MNKAHVNINWENYPSDVTPINEANLNKMDSSIDTIDDRVISLDTIKLDKVTAATMVKDVAYNESTGIFTITYLNGATIILDTKMEKLAVNFSFDKENQKLIIVLDDGTKQEVDLSALITEYEFSDTDTIAFSVDSTGKVSAIVKDGSITEDKLQPNFLADIKVEVAKAQASATAAATSETNAKTSETNSKASETAAKTSETNAKASEMAAATSESNAAASASAAETSATNAASSADAASSKADAAAMSEQNAKASETAAASSASTASTKANAAAESATEAADSATDAESYAHGGTGTRTGEDADNSKYYYEQTKQISQSLNGIIPQGTVTFANLPTDGMEYGYMYNISDAFTSDERFNDGGGVYYGAGNNVIWVSGDKWDVTAGSGVTGVKGNKETTYRQGNVNITPANIGALEEDGNAVSATKATQDGNGNNIVDTYQTKTGNTNDNSTTFTSADSTSPTAWTDVAVLASGEKHSSLFNKISTMFKNIRWLYKMLGTTDISAYGDGTVTGALKTVITDLSSKANAADLAAKASAADLNAEKNTRASVDASLQSQINDTKSVASFAFGTIISTVAEFSDGYLNKKDGVVYFSFEFKIINITNGVTTNIASIPYKPYGICHCSATLYNGNTSFPVFTAINDGIIQVHLPSDCVLSSNKENNKLRFSGSFPAKN